MAAPTLAQLRTIDLFDALDDEQLGQWAAVAELREAAAGDVLLEQGEPVAFFMLLLEGTAATNAVLEGRVEPGGEHHAPTWMGAIASLTGGPMPLRNVAVTDVRYAAVAPADVITLAMAQRPVFMKIMAQVPPVFGSITAREANRERLASLGTMAAGLAHELNNPAAAAKRAAAQLAEALDVLGATIGRFVESGIERDQAVELVALQRQAMEQAIQRGPMGALDAADAEDDLLEQLEALDVPEPWRLVEPLASAGVDAAWLERLARHAGPVTAGALRWVAASLSARVLAAELAESTERMSHLVGAIKSYAYMDRGTLNEVDLREGLETTLTVLGHKLKHRSITVERHYEPDLPKLTVHGPELNQVWTNLLDNAIDALGEQGTITITTRREDPCAVVEIADDGPGIPADVIDRVFDPFFTTKGVGQGTGLGLDAARRIVQERHHGSLTVTSVPGRTLFRVWLPLEHTAR